VPEALDERRADFAWARAELAQLLSPEELRAAARNTLNAHYTDLSLVQPIWEAVARLGFTEGPVLEPGCGSGRVRPRSSPPCTNALQVTPPRHRHLLRVRVRGEACPAWTVAGFRWLLADPASGRQRSRRAARSE
jgi:hypothetical protein